MLNYRQMMLDVLQGKPTPHIPWAPRLDLWYKANKRAGTLPEKYRKASLMEMTDDLDFGFHAIVPEFKDYKDKMDEAHRPLGIYNQWFMPYKTKFHNVKVRVDFIGDETVTEYGTPHGSIKTKSLYDEGMKKAGISISHISEHALKSIEDFKAVAYIFDNAEVITDFSGYVEFSQKVGDRGIPAAFLSLAGSPMHHIQRELIGMEQFFYEMVDHPEELAVLSSAVGGYYDKMLESAVKCPASLYLFGANYDASITVAPFFKEHILPWLRKAAEKLHKHGKYILTHTDGENTGLLEYFLESGIDIADSICPFPMTKLKIDEVRKVFNGKITIMGGIPSVTFLKSSMSDRDFEKYIEDFLTAVGKGDHLILGVSDTTPPAAEFERLKLVGKKCKEFGKIK